jgi:hypothetical protein
MALKKKFSHQVQSSNSCLKNENTEENLSSASNFRDDLEQTYLHSESPHLKSSSELNLQGKNPS